MKVTESLHRDKCWEWTWSHIFWQSFWIFFFHPAPFGLGAAFLITEGRNSFESSLLSITVPSNHGHWTSMEQGQNYTADKPSRSSQQGHKYNTALNNIIQVQSGLTEMSTKCSQNFTPQSVQVSEDSGAPWTSGGKSSTKFPCLPFSDVLKKPHLSSLTRFTSLPQKNILD